MSNLPTKLSFGFFRSLLWKSNWVKFCGENVRKNCGRTVHFGMISPQKPWKSIVASFLLKKWSKNSGFLPNFSSKALKKLCVLGLWHRSYSKNDVKNGGFWPDFFSETLKKCAFLAGFHLKNSGNWLWHRSYSKNDVKNDVFLPDFFSETLKKCAFLTGFHHKNSGNWSRHRLLVENDVKLSDICTYLED